MDLDNEEHIALFVDAFYRKVLKDKVLRPIFIDGAKIDIQAHKGIICQYWQKLLLGDKTYNRHTMNIHRAVHAHSAFSEDAFDRWLNLFMATAREDFKGPYAERAVVVASTIADNMKKALLSA